MASPTHVVLDQIREALSIKESFWSVFAAVAAACAAIATAILAWLTRNLAKATGLMASETKKMAAQTAALAEQTATQAKESAQSIEQAQRHHEQSLMPIVWVRLDCKLDWISVPREAGMMSVPGMVMTIELVNSGLGPASAVFLHLRSSAYTPQHVIYLGLIGPNTERSFSIPVELGTRSSLEYSPYDCVTQYETIFNTFGAIAQRSASGKSKDATVTLYFPPSDTSEATIKDFLTNAGLPTQRTL